jgi:flagellar protein FliO/FliZ
MNTLALMLAVAPAAAEFDPASELVRVILSLFGIIALIVVAGWLTRRL